MGWSNETHSDIFIDEFLEGFEFKRRKGVDRSDGRCSTFLKIDLEVIRVVFHKCISFLLAKQISKFMVFLGDFSEVY